MVRTKAEVKLKLREWIEQRQEPFTTIEAKEELKKSATNILLSPNRLTNYIRATEAAEFDPKEKHWKVRLKPLKRKQ
jgi:hypothetical protein